MASKEDVTGRKQGNKNVCTCLLIPFPVLKKALNFA